jgi:phosphate:Na+ symporter
MTLPLVVLNIAGAAALLIWAVRMVRTGVERAHGAALRRLLRRIGDDRFRAAGTGTLMAVLLQSSTAVAMLAAGFAASGLLAVPTGLALVLGADLGSALVVRILSLDLGWLTPVLMVTGAALFLKSGSRAVRQTGRILIGVALILLSLRLIGEATEPLRDAGAAPAIVEYLRRDFITAFVLGALFTWLVHSSVASILLVASLAAQGVLPLELGLSLMLGANLGGGLIAFGLTRASTPEARRIPTGNLIFRAAGSVAALLAVHRLGLPLDLAGADPAARIVNLHVAFNLALVALCLPLTGPVARLTERLHPPAAADPELLSRRVSALDRTVLDMPGRALASATRETLQMGETVERMLRPVMEVYETGDRERIRQIKRLNGEVTATHSAVKLYLAELNRGVLDAEQSRRSMELAGFAINLQNAGDLIARNLMGLAQERADGALAFSPEGWREMTDVHDRVVNNMQLALNVMVSGDRDSARQLVEEKDRMRDLERISYERHLKRLEKGATRSIETSDIHIETVRTLKQINSLLATMAYGILTESGELLDTRLAERDDA